MGNDLTNDIELDGARDARVGLTLSKFLSWNHD